MSKFNLQKARAKLRAAEDEALRDEILSGEEKRTVQWFLKDLERETGWKPTHFARYIGYSQKAIKRWIDQNYNVVLVRDVCAGIKRKYWHERNNQQFNYNFDEE